MYFSGRVEFWPTMDFVACGDVFIVVYFCDGGGVF